ncbi:monooxygenase [Dactylosporangium sp. NPDC005572]|uniref:monooxygenase n=1 Tax=Dactylosporangium sp. NPDC005572 TaxID=3156889 RepID=UPI0033B54C3D
MRSPHQQQHTNTQPDRAHRTNRRTTESSSGPRIAVIGGSLTGPTVALLLTQAGFAHVNLYEATPASTTLGGGLISLEHSSLGILDHLGIEQNEYVHVPSETIWQTPVHNRVLGDPTRRAYPGRFTTWTQLNQALTCRIPGDMVHTGARVIGLTEHGRCALLHFADGRTEPADLVVFADGRASAGRNLLDPGRRLRYAGYVGHRGTVTFNPTGMADFWRLEPGPGIQFNIAPIPDGADWTFYLNTTPNQYAEMFGAAPHRRLFAHPRHVSDAARAYVDGHAVWHLPDPYATAVHCTTARAAFPVMDIDPPARMVWPIGDGFAVLLGDALAPVRAHTARGANNGIEQADGLVTALCQHRRHSADLGTALTGWQRRHLHAAVAAVRLGPAIGARLGLGAAPTLGGGAAVRPSVLAGAR